VVGQLLGEDVARWLPFRSGAALADLPDAGIAALSQGQAAFALVAYAAVLAVAGVSVTVRRDVS
jgi:hypothetical protein